MSRLTVVSLAAVLMSASAFAKLPAPSDETKAKAAEAAAKTAWTDKVGAYKLCQAMNRVAERYHKTAAKDAAAPVATPPCADPGAYVSPTAAASAPPLEAAGAHSPPKTATAPPAGKATAAQVQGTAKK
ncbi:MAG: hypothetical protein ABI702_11175 [Burkholderiales bacterium]